MTEGTPLSIALRLETPSDSFWRKGPIVSSWESTEAIAS